MNVELEFLVDFNALLLEANELVSNTVFNVAEMIESVFSIVKHKGFDFWRLDFCVLFK